MITVLSRNELKVLHVLLRAEVARRHLCGEPSDNQSVNNMTTPKLETLCKKLALTVAYSPVEVKPYSNQSLPFPTDRT